jgi:hypothetical protein
MPNAVSDHGPRVFFRECPGSCESRINLSMDLRATSCLNRTVLLIPPPAGPENNKVLPVSGDFQIQDAFDAVYRVRVSSWKSLPFPSGP